MHAPSHLDLIDPKRCRTPGEPDRTGPRGHPTPCSCRSVRTVARPTPRMSSMHRSFWTVATRNMPDPFGRYWASKHAQGRANRLADPPKRRNTPIQSAGRPVEMDQRAANIRVRPQAVPWLWPLDDDPSSPHRIDFTRACGPDIPQRSEAAGDGLCGPAGAVPMGHYRVTSPGLTHGVHPG